MDRAVFTKLWIVWLVAFVVIEGLAIYSDTPKVTLSAHIRGWFSQQPLWVIIMGWIACIGLTIHFLWDLR